jgi:2-iminobutanoate/2-iminopropanoate deaminase
LNRRPPVAGPYAPAVRAGTWVVTSGQLGTVTAADGSPVLVLGGTGAQLRQALANLEAALATCGATFDDVRKTTVFLADMDDFAEMNAVWVDVWGERRPARSAVGVAGLPLGAHVEVEAWARAPV